MNCKFTRWGSFTKSKDLEVDVQAYWLQGGHEFPVILSTTSVGGLLCIILHLFHPTIEGLCSVFCHNLFHIGILHGSTFIWSMWISMNELHEVVWISKYWKETFIERNFTAKAHWTKDVQHVHTTKFNLQQMFLPYVLGQAIFILIFWIFGI